LIRKTAVETILACEREGRFLHRELDRRLRSLVLDPRDRALLRELVLGPVRRRGTLDAVLAAYAPRGLRGIRPRLLEILRQAVHQILFLERVPARAAVDEAVKLVREAFPDPMPGFANGLLRAVLRGAERREAAGADAPGRRTLPREDGSAWVFDRDVFPDPLASPAAHLAAKWSHPEWLVARWLGRLSPEETESLLAANDRVPALGLRANPLRASRDDLARRLAAAGIAARPVDGAPDSLVVAAGAAGPVEALPGFEEGLFVVQDPTAARVAPLLEPEPGRSYLDVGAAPGGKATHLAILARDGARIVAADPSAERLARVAENAARLGLRSIECVEMDGRDAGARFGPIFDGVLVDAPCSNTGTLGRRVEARWRLDPEDLVTLPDLQLALLIGAAGAVKPGGRLVYGTCSVEEEENEAVVRRFLAARPGFALASESTAWPHRGDGDGGYSAVLLATPS
jgi:16S rRNA (cytosine967-C5)-methyltransferase